MTTRELRHATIRNMFAIKSARIAKIAHRAAWLMEVRGHSEFQVARHMRRFGTANSIRPIVIQYQMIQGFVLKGVADGKPRVPGSLITKGVREARAGSGG